MLFTDTLPDAIASDCSKCSEKQREGSLQVTHYLIDNHPEEWERLEKVYDSSGEYRRHYLESKAKAAADGSGSAEEATVKSAESDEKK